MKDFIKMGAIACVVMLIASCGNTGATTGGITQPVVKDLKGPSVPLMIYVSLETKDVQNMWYAVAVSGTNSYRFGWGDSEGGVSFEYDNGTYYAIDDRAYTYVKVNSDFDKSGFSLASLGGSMKSVFESEIDMKSLQKSGVEEVSGYACDVYKGKYTAGSPVTAYFTKDSNFIASAKDWENVRLDIFRNIGFDMLYLDSEKGYLAGVSDENGTTIRIQFSTEVSSYTFSLDDYSEMKAQ